MTEDIHAERRIHELEAQLRTARDDALEEAAKVARRRMKTRFSYLDPIHIAHDILALKGTPA